MSKLIEEKRRLPLVLGVRLCVVYAFLLASADLAEWIAAAERNSTTHIKKQNTVACRLQPLFHTFILDYCGVRVVIDL